MGTCQAVAAYKTKFFAYGKNPWAEKKITECLASFPGRQHFTCVTKTCTGGIKHVTSATERGLWKSVPGSPALCPMGLYLLLILLCILKL